MKINPVQSVVAWEFGNAWNYPEFGREYRVLIAELNCIEENKKLVRFFDDFNRDLKKLSSRPKAAFIIRIGDYLNRIAAIDFDRQVLEELVSRFLRHLWRDLIEASCKPNGSEAWEMWEKYYHRKGKDPHFRVFVGLV